MDLAAAYDAVPSFKLIFQAGQILRYVLFEMLASASRTQHSIWPVLHFDTGKVWWGRAR